MSHSRSRREGRTTAARQRMRRRRILWVGTIAIVLAIVAGATALILRGDTDEPSPAANQPTSDTRATWSVTAHTGGPRLAVDRTGVEEGKVPYGHSVQAIYRLKSVGDSVLSLGEPAVRVLEGC